jgi:hypothetical protein
MIRTVQIELSTRELKLTDRTSRHDFWFVIVSKSFSCDRFRPIFLSPRSANSILDDSALEEFMLAQADSRSLKFNKDSICGSWILLVSQRFEIDKFWTEWNDFDITESQKGLNLSNCISRLKWKMFLRVTIFRECDFNRDRFSHFEFQNWKLGELRIYHFHELPESQMKSLLNFHFINSPIFVWIELQNHHGLE